MKLLFDQNLSFKLCRLLSDIFPDSAQVRLDGLADAEDSVIWHKAGSNGFVMVSQDSDFADMAALYGPPPKVIWLRCGNQPTQEIESLLRKHAETVLAFERDTTAASDILASPRRIGISRKRGEPDLVENLCPHGRDDHAP
jgi:predicted nuclease of predicted toxin-antitoxin system